MEMLVQRTAFPVNIQGLETEMLSSKNEKRNVIKTSGCCIARTSVNKAIDHIIIKMERETFSG